MCIVSCYAILILKFSSRYKQLNVSIDIDGKLNILLFADDVILFGNTKEDLQLLLKCDLSLTFQTTLKKG